MSTTAAICLECASFADESLAADEHKAAPPGFEAFGPPSSIHGARRE